MKQTFIIILLLMIACLPSKADTDIYKMKWAKVATSMNSEWYGSDQAKEVAENVLLYQKDNGGWMKNIEMHQPLTESQKAAVRSEKSEHSCFDNGVQCILDCQINDNGTKSIWCAQHDGKTLLPTEGRPHELPSFSGSESAKILSFLMTLDNPSDAVKAAVKAAAEWFDAHATLNKKVVDVTENGKVVDRKIIDAPGSHLWGRFMQLAGETAKEAYSSLVVRHTEKRTVYDKDGNEHRYVAGENFTAAYDATKPYAYMYGIYDDNLQQLYYRPLYNYADTDPYYDKNGVLIATSLTADTRKSYQYVGSWAEDAVYKQYPQWKAKYTKAR